MTYSLEKKVKIKLERDYYERIEIIYIFSSYRLLRDLQIEIK